MTSALLQMERRLRRACLVIALTILAGSAVAAEPTAEKMLLEARPDVRQAVDESATLPALQINLPKVTIDGQEFYVAEGDLLLDEDQLRIYVAQQDAMVRARTLGVLLESTITTQLEGSLTEEGKIVRWESGKVLTYCVLRNTFLSKENYELAVANMKKAAANWEATCGVKFQYLETHDNDQNIRPEGVLFPVRQIDARGTFIAESFLPTDPIDRRRLLLDGSYFATQFDKVGVLRHELGHIIGFRHEHIRSGAPAVCPHEPLNRAIDLTKYDPQSVMHYFCGNVGSRELKITQLDRDGSQRLYGAPLASVQSVR